MLTPWLCDFGNTTKKQKKADCANYDYLFERTSTVQALFHKDFGTERHIRSQFRTHIFQVTVIWTVVTQIVDFRPHVQHHLQVSL